jgi:hypothetical protein
MARVAVPVWVDDGVAEAVGVVVAGTTDVAVAVCGGLPVAVAVPEAVEVRVKVAVLVAVAVWEAVAVGVCVAVEVGEAVAVGVLVGFGVAVGSRASTTSWGIVTAPASRLARLSAVPLEVVRARLKIPLPVINDVTSRLFHAAATTAPETPRGFPNGGALLKLRVDSLQVLSVTGRAS